MILLAFVVKGRHLYFFSILIEKFYKLILNSLMRLNEMCISLPQPENNRESENQFGHYKQLTIKRTIGVTTLEMSGHNNLPLGLNQVIGLSQ